jgi:hypothetical protein
MPKMKPTLISMLVLTNAITGVVLWRSQERIQYLAKEANVFANESTRYRQEVHSKNHIAQTTDFAPMPTCMKNLDAKDLTYFSASAQQISIVYHCNDKQNLSSLRFYRWPLVEKPRPSDSFNFGTLQPPDLKLAIAMVGGS